MEKRTIPLSSCSLGENKHFVTMTQNIKKITKRMKKNKKVLLRERKRHTVRHVSRTLCAALSPGREGGGYSHQASYQALVGLDGRYPHPRGVERHTPVKTVPSPFLRNAGGNDVTDLFMKWSIRHYITMMTAHQRRVSHLPSRSHFPKANGDHFSKNHSSFIELIHSHFDSIEPDSEIFCRSFLFFVKDK